MNRKFVLVLAFIAALGILSCKKDDNYVHAVIVDTQDVTYEGCGYLLKLDDNALLKPLYLPGAYQHDGLEVMVQYDHTDIKDTCQYGSIIYDMVNVSDIKRAEL